MPTDYTSTLAGGVLTLTLNRPAVLNALTLELYAELRDLFADLAHDDAVKAVVVTGEGRAFCSGGDVNEIIGPVLERDMRGHLEFCRLTGHLVRNMRLLPKPIVAAVNGIAAGAGAVIALACDLRVVSAEARFAFLFARVGLTGADMGAAFLLPRLVGQGRAMELLLLGDDVDAAAAERFGLANRVVPPAEVLPAAQALAARLAHGPTYAHGLTKLMVNNEWTMDLVSALEAEAQAQALMMMGADHRAFYEAFREKRPPRFEGR
jgi:enoyl-CoA hydratase/carnithine racemase